MRSVPPARGRLAAAAAVAVVALTACGSDGGSDAERFCGEIAADPAAVVAPDLSTPAALDATLAHYRMLAELAPAAIDDEWDAVVLNIETASTVVPADPESVQRAVAQAYATERSAVAVREWLLRNCGVDLGPVSTITPQGRVTPPTSAAPPTGSSGATTPPAGGG